MSVIGTGGGPARNSLVFQHFHSYFCILSHFTIFSYSEQIRNLSFRLKYILLIRRFLKQCLLNILHRFSGHTGVITCRVKEKSADRIWVRFERNTDLFPLTLHVITPGGMVRKNWCNAPSKRCLISLFISNLYFNPKDNFLFVQDRKIS